MTMTTCVRASLALLALATFACGSSACSSSPVLPGPGAEKGDGDDAPAPGGRTSETGPFGQGGTEPTPGDGSVIGATVDEIYAHSVDTLYRLDPVTKKVDVVGRFTGCTSDVIDIALDADSNLFGTTRSDGGGGGGGGSTGGLWRIDRKTAACTRIAQGTYPNSLSFVPKGTVDAAAEALVGYQDNNDYVRIDTKTGAVTKVGSLGNGGFSSSGDIVSVKGGSTYLSVNGNGCSDCLVEVNPATGAVTRNWGTLGHSDVFGVAFWGGKVYGFDDGGGLFEVTFGSGQLGTTDIAIPNASGAMQFGGAGSTTSAPLTAPPR